MNFFSRKICRCDHQGEQKTTILETESSAEKAVQINNVTAVGNYIYADYYTFEDHNASGLYDEAAEHYISWTNPADFHILRIDTQTGEQLKLNIPKP